MALGYLLPPAIRRERQIQQMAAMLFRDTCNRQTGQSIDTAIHTAFDVAEKFQKAVDQRNMKVKYDPKDKE